MPFVSGLHSVPQMERITRLPGSRAAEYPEADICRIDGVWHAWIPDGHGGGSEAHGDTEGELLAKLSGGGSAA